MNKIIILGGQGNLGTQLQRYFPEAIVWDRTHFDATDYAELERRLMSVQDLGLIINCVAFNDLDVAEQNPELAYKLNAELPLNLATIAKRLQIPLIHYSTGYVFSGQNQTEHHEYDLPNPNSVYAQSKLAGEENIENVRGQHYIIRTNVLFGPKGISEAAKPSVIDFMHKIGAEKGLLKGVTDEISNFTYTPDLASATASLIANPPAPGTYHLTNEGYGSWYDLAHEIFFSLGYTVVDQPHAADVSHKIIAIHKITGADYPRAAKRPTSAVIINNKLPKLRPWQEALKEYLTHIV